MNINKEFNKINLKMMQLREKFKIWFNKIVN